MVFSECDMKNWNNIKLTTNGNRANLVLSREQKHNAIFPALIEEMHEALNQIKMMEDLHFVVLSGEGPSFCAGADMNWFAQSVEQPKTESWEEYLRLAELLKSLYELPQLTIAAVHKNVLGGGNGLMAACDFAVAERSTAFAFSEVKLGLIPATIMPFVAMRISVQNMKKLFFSGERFWASEAQLIGLVDFLTDDGKLHQTVDELIENLGKVSPNALKTCKQLLQKAAGGEVNINSGDYTSAVLTELVQSPEGQEGMRAFLERRDPDWKAVKQHMDR